MLYFVLKWKLLCSDDLPSQCRCEVSSLAGFLIWILNPLPAIQLLF